MVVEERPFGDGGARSRKECGSRAGRVTTRPNFHLAVAIAQDVAHGIVEIRAHV